MKKLALFLLSALLFWSATCDDDDAVPSDPCSKYYKPLPEATKTGRRIFSCEMNGEDWVAYDNPRDVLSGAYPHVNSLYNKNTNVTRVAGSRIISEPECDTFNQFLVLITLSKLGEKVT